MMGYITELFRNYPISCYKRLLIIISICITFILVIDTLTSRQILPYDNTSGALLSVSNLVIGYGLGPWIIFSYANRVSKDITSTHSFVKRIIQFAVVSQLLLLVLFTMVFVEFYIYENSTRFLSSLAFAISTISASFIMGYIAWKFFLWFKLSNRNITILIYGLAASSLAIAMISDGCAKLLLVQVIEEGPSLSVPQGQQPMPQKPEAPAASYDVFIYKLNDKYKGELQYKVVKPHGTTLYVVPAAIRILYAYVNGWIPITVSFIFTWAITLITLHEYYQRKDTLHIKHYCILILPVVLYFLGRTPDFYTLFTGHVFTFDNLPNPYLFRILFRVGVIGGSILFGLSFFVVSRGIAIGKIRDCMVLAAIGASMIGISLSPSGLQQTYGVEGRSLMLLSSFLYSIGFYLSAAYIAQDSSLRKYFKTVNKLDILGGVGQAQMQSEIIKNVTKVVRDQQETIKEQSGISLPGEVNDVDLKLYINEVVEEVKRIRRS
jgi:hypothetical protein